MIRVYYGNGEVWTSEDEKPPPSRDVQVIAQDDDRTGWYTVTGSDYYIQRDGVWVGVDVFGLYDFLLDSGLVLFGRTIDADEYATILARARSEMHYRKSARLPGER